MTDTQRARQELEAARLLAAGGFPAQAISRAYYAAFYAAERSLAALGESRSKHAGVIAAFGMLVVRQRGLGEEHGRVLRSLFEQRNMADYGELTASADEAECAIAEAARFVGAVDAWLAEQSPEDRRR